MAALPACLQPRLGLEIFGSVPPGCFGYLVDDDWSLPVLRRGEVAIVDVSARDPEAGSLFVIEWLGGDRELVETYQHLDYPQDGIQRLSWWTSRYNRPRSREELDDAILRRLPLRSSDGPYDKAEHLAEKLIGKVVGVLAPDRHSREELMRRRDVRTCSPHILATGYGAQPRGYVEPAGSAKYHRETGRRRKRASR